MSPWMGLRVQSVPAAFGEKSGRGLGADGTIYIDSKTHPRSMTSADLPTVVAHRRDPRHPPRGLIVHRAGRGWEHLVHDVEAKSTDCKKPTKNCKTIEQLVRPAQRAKNLVFYLFEQQKRNNLVEAELPPLSFVEVDLNGIGLLHVIAHHGLLGLQHPQRSCCHSGKLCQDVSWRQGVLI